MLNNVQTGRRLLQDSSADHASLVVGGLKAARLKPAEYVKSVEVVNSAGTSECYHPGTDISTMPEACHTSLA